MGDSESTAVRTTTSNDVLAGEMSDIEVSFTPKASETGSVWIQTSDWTHDDDATTGSKVMIGSSEHTAATLSSNSNGLFVILGSVTMTEAQKQSVVITKLTPKASASWMGTSWKVATCSKGTTTDSCDYDGTGVNEDNGAFIGAVGVMTGAGVVPTMTAMITSAADNDAGAQSTWTLALSALTEAAGGASKFFHIILSGA
eukprot:Filipodium_phascolosomae@DN1833_c0_g1_i1.p1